MNLSMRFDLRVPPFAPTTFAAQHAAMLDMVEWAEAHDFDSIVLSEHHGDPAGFSSAPLTLAAAVLARTRRIAVTISAALVPLHDPIRLAEQLATLDCLAPDRLGVVLGAGYREFEFAMAGIERSERGPRVEECVHVLRKAFTGEPFEWRGREMLVTPRPATPGGPAISVGGKTIAGAKRAARLEASFSPAVSGREVIAAYFEEADRIGFTEPVVYGCRTLGEYEAANPPGRPSPPGFVWVAPDPEEAWRAIGPHAEYDATTYSGWQEDGVVSDWAVPGVFDAEGLEASGRYAVVTPEGCLALAARDASLMLHPLMGGLDPALAWDSLTLLEREVLPKLR